MLLHLVGLVLIESILLIFISDRCIKLRKRLERYEHNKKPKLPKDLHTGA